MSGVAKRAILMVGVAFYALLAVISAADRGDLVPFAGALPVPPYPAQALLAQARQHVSTGDYRGALVSAREAVLANPVEPSSPALLGAALLGVGDEAGARRAFTVAGRMGWRVPLTQTYWMEQALAAGDFRVAALRLDALALQNPAIAADLYPAREFERSTPGRQALVDRLRRDPAWLQRYLDPVPEAGSDDLVARAGVAQQLLAAGAPLECAQFARFVSRLVDAGQGRIGQAIWRQACPGAGAGTEGGLLLDGNLRTLNPAGQQPFGWQLVSDPDLTIAPAGGRGGVILANSAPARRPALRQLVAVSPGTYRLSWIARGPGGMPSDRIVAATQCAGSAQVPLDARALGSDGGRGGDFPVPGSCTAVWIEFQVLAGTSEAMLSSVALAPVGK